MINIGLQLYTVRDECEKDFKETIKKVATIGYKGLEFAGYYGMDAGELKHILDDLGIKAVSAHVPLSNLKKSLEAEIEYVNTLGMKAITLPWLPEENTKDEDAFLRTSELISVLDEKCVQHGIQLCYHNHDFEFHKIKDEYILDIFLKNAKNLKLELDTFWISYAGIDTIEYMSNHASRLHFIHLKDMIKDEKPIFAEVGEGSLDIGSFIKLAVKFGVEWAFVEQDICKRQSLESARISFENIKKMGFVK